MQITVKVFKAAGELEFFAGDMSLGRCGIDKFNTAYAQMGGRLTGELLPPAIRFIRGTVDGGRVILLEDKPQYRMFQFTEQHQDTLNPDGVSKHTFYLPFPWMQLIIKISSSNVVEDIRGYLSQTPFVGRTGKTFFGTHHWPIPMHNWYEDGKLCRPQYSGNGFDDEAGDSVFSILNSVQNELWGSGYNNDLYQTVLNYYDYWVNMCSSEEGFDGYSLFDAADHGYWDALRDRNQAHFFLRYYQAWASYSIDEILKMKWQHNQATYLGTLVDDMCAGGDERRVSWPALNSRILGAAQTASMM